MTSDSQRPMCNARLEPRMGVDALLYNMRFLLPGKSGLPMLARGLKTATSSKSS